MEAEEKEVHINVFWRKFSSGYRSDRPIESSQQVQDLILALSDGYIF